MATETASDAGTFEVDIEGELTPRGPRSELFCPYHDDDKRQRSTERVARADGGDD